jgi:hypothetical protein
MRTTRRDRVALLPPSSAATCTGVVGADNAVARVARDRDDAAVGFDSALARVRGLPRNLRMSIAPLATNSVVDAARESERRCSTTGLAERVNRSDGGWIQTEDP